MDMLRELYAACCSTPDRSPNQAHAMAQAATVLGSVGTPAQVIRATYEALMAAFEN